MLKFFKKHEEVLLVLDIGGSSVKAAVVSVKKDQNKILILSFYQEYFDTEIFGDEDINYDNLRLNVLRAKFFVEKNAKIKVKKVVIGLAEEFIKNLTLSIKHKREDPIAKIDINEIQNILLKVRWRIKGNIKNQSKNFNINIIEGAIQEVLIDGWRVINPLGFNGKELTMNLFYSYLDNVYLDILNKLIKDLKIELYAIFSKSYSIIRLAIERNDPNLSAIFVNLSTHRTDLFLVSRGKILSTSSFGVGAAAITKKIAERLRIGFFEAENIKLKYSEDRLSQRLKNSVKVIIDKELQRWFNGVALGIKDFKTTEVLPPLVLIYGGGANLNDILKYPFKPNDISPQLFFKGKPKMVVLKPELNEVEDLTSIIAKDPSNTAFFSISRRLLELKKGSSKLDTIVKKI